MSNKFIIVLFICFMLVVLYSSLQKVSNTQPTANAPVTPSMAPTATPLSPTVTPAPTSIPTTVPAAIQQPQFRVSGGGEAGDN